MAHRDLSPTDGRVVRRAENRESALRCAIDLFSTNKFTPTVEDVASTSGISIRSLYRYFGDGQGMLREAIELLIDETRPLALFPGLGEGPLPDRIAALVAGRFRAYQHVRPALRAIIVNIGVMPELTSAQRTTRERLTWHFNRQFAPELELLDDESRSHVSQAGNAVCSLEFLGMLVERQEIPVDTAQAIVIRLLTNVLAPAPM